MRRRRFKLWTVLIPCCRSRPDAERTAFEYDRHGMLSLYAALDVKTGQMHGMTANTDAPNTTGSETFSITGTGSATPEPATGALILAGLVTAGLAKHGFFWRFRKRQPVVPAVPHKTVIPRARGNSKFPHGAESRPLIWVASF
jgi:PEP-CTERM motif